MKEKIKELNYFNKILTEEYFKFITDKNNILTIKEIIINKLSEKISEKEKNKYILLLKDYYYNLIKVYNNFHKIDDIRKGVIIINNVIKSIINLLNEPSKKREALSRKSYRGINKDFFYGLNKLVSGLKIIFDPEIVSYVTVSNNDIINFIQDKNIGLGKYYLFNKIGKNSFIKKIYKLNENELKVVLKFLTKPSSNQKRTYNGWLDIGIKKSPIRILIKKNNRIFNKKKEIYFLFKVTEHKDYEYTINKRPEEFSFEAA